MVIRYGIAIFIIFSSASALADRCDTLYHDACEITATPHADGTGLLATKSNIEARRKLYQETLKKMRDNFRFLINTDPEIKKKYTAATFFSKNSCVGEPCIPPTEEQKFELAFQYVADPLSRLNLDPWDGSKPANSFVDAHFSMEDLALLDGPKFKTLADKAKEEIYAKVAPAYRKNYLTDQLFVSIQSAALQVVARLPDGPDKAAFIDRIKRSTMTVSECDSDLLDGSAFNENGKISYCYGMMASSSSLYMELFVISHELGHSIDPCALPANANAWRGLVSCLRSSSSVGAQILGKPSASTSCAPNRSDKDQIGESFADWFAAEIASDLTTSLTASMKTANSEMFSDGMSNVLRTQCARNIGAADTQEEDADIDEHPMNAARLDLFITQPKIRSRMGCAPQSKKTYCDINQPSPAIEIQDRPDQNSTSPRR